MRCSISRWLGPAAVGLIFAGVTTASGCLGPLVSDDVVSSALILPPGAVAPMITDDAALSAQIDANDGVSGALVRLRSGFYAGEQVQYWDFGEAPTVAVPIWVFVEAASDGRFEIDGQRFEPAGHWSVIDTLPGDVGYSPWWQVFLVPVTDRWRGEQFTSVEAIDAGVSLGLLEAPVPQPLAVNCPVVLPEVRLAAPSGPPKAPDPGYYRGYEVHWFTFDAVPLDDNVIPTARVFSLRREGGEPLSEPVRGVDMTGDGDQDDTNDLFEAGQPDAAYSGMVEVFEVVMSAEYGSIDTYRDDASADLTEAARLWTADGQLDPTWVVALYPTGVVLNRPLFMRPPAVEAEP